jgi:glutamine amidotransferase-like uncharacterized protein
MRWFAAPRFPSEIRNYGGFVRLFFSSPASALRCSILVALAVITPVTFTGCGSAAFLPPATTKVALADPVTAAAAAVTESSTTPAAAASVQAGPVAAAAASVQATSSRPPVLLFNGTGTSSSDVAAEEAVLNTLKLSYATANTSQLNSMSEATLKTYKLLIVPGGNSITIGNHLTKTTTTNIHNAVNGGLHYLGVCAGAFFGGYSIYNGLNLTNGVWFNLYSSNTGKQVADVRFSDGTVYDIYEQDGPELAGWGSIVGEYSNGKPAMAEGKFGSGWVILSGVHPEAPASWRTGMDFTTPLATDLAYAGKLVTYALNGSSLPHY